MAPPLSPAPAQLRQMINYHLDNNLSENALFLAQRLQVLEPRNSDVTHLVASCHYRLAQYKAAYDCSRMAALRSAHLGCCYIFAQACLQLQRFTDGITALDRSKVLWTDKNYMVRLADSRRQSLPDAAAVYCLLGKLLQGNMEVKRAVDSYAEALKLNPFMWDAFERLCSLGANLRPSSIFKPNPDVMAFLAGSLEAQHLDEDRAQAAAFSTTAPLQSQAPNSYLVSTPMNDPFQSVKTPVETGLSVGGNNLLSRINIGPSLDNVSPPEMKDGDVPGNEASAVSSSLDPPNAPVRKTRGVASSASQSANSVVSSVQAFTSRNRSKARSDEPSDTQEPRRMNLFATQQPPHPSKRTVSGSVSSHPPTSHHPSTSLLSSTVATSTDPAAPQRRSVRLFRQKDRAVVPAPAAPVSKEALADVKKAKATGTRGRTANSATVGRVVSGNRKPLEPSEAALRDHRSLSNIAEVTVQSQQQSTQRTIAALELAKSHEATHALLDLLGRMGQGYYALTKYQCAAALQYFQGLPMQHRETPWVLAQIGKAFFEQGQYFEAEKTFAKIRKTAPSRFEDMEVYSTVLWHLKNDTELAFLSHELIEADRFAPQSWTTIGNSFSLQREHDQALKCFKRATQLDPKFAYGFTLQGHEHVANEEYDKALQAYRKAINADQRHYNGWYGLAKVYEKQGKYAEAELHYRVAAKINPNNAILECCIGMALEKLKKPLPALHQYQHACEINPASAVARFRKAKLLLNLHRLRDAQEEFLVLKDLAPDEANVHFMLGRVYKISGDKANAIKHLTIALNLDPKAGPYIKEAMESLDDDDEEMEDDDDREDVMS